MLSQSYEHRRQSLRHMRPSPETLLRAVPVYAVAALPEPQSPAIHGKDPQIDRARVLDSGTVHSVDHSTGYAICVSDSNDLYDPHDCRTRCEAAAHPRQKQQLPLVCNGRNVMRIGIR